MIYATSNVVVSNIVTATDFWATSDERAKENIRPLENALDIIRTVDIHKFKFKKSGEEAIGVIAQELEKILPEAVSIPDDPNLMMQVKYNYLFSVLVQAVQELADKYDDLTK